MQPSNLQTTTLRYFPRKAWMNATGKLSGIWKAKWKINGTPTETNLYLCPLYNKDTSSH